MDPNRSQKRIYSLTNEGGATGLNNILRLISEDIATLQGQNGPAKIGDRYDLTSERNDTNLTLKSGTDFNTDMAQFKSADGTVRSRLDNQGRFWNQFSSPYEDLLVNLNTAKATGGGAVDPTWLDLSAGAQRAYAWAFSPSAINILYWTAQLPHSWKEGSTLYPHVHWMPTTANAGNVLWQLGLYKADINSAYPTFASPSPYYQPSLAVSSGTIRQHQVSAFPPLTMVGNKISNVFLGRLLRIANDATDTYPDDAVALYVDFHHEVDSLGSRSEFLK